MIINRIKIIESVYLLYIGLELGLMFGITYDTYSDDIVTIDPHNNIEDIKSLIESLSYYLFNKFINFGGLSELNFDKIHFSQTQDILIVHDILESINKQFNDDNKLFDLIVKNYIISFKELKKHKKIINKFILSYIKKLKKKYKWQNYDIDLNIVTANAPIHTCLLGLIFYENESLNKLIELTILITSILFPNNIAILGSIASSLFVKYAFNKIEPQKWIFNLLDLLNSSLIDDIYQKIKPSFYSDFIETKKEFILKINIFIETSFNDKIYIVDLNNNRSIFPGRRIIYYYDNITYDKKKFKPGNNAIEVLIIAYDLFLMAGDNFEKLIYQSMISMVNASVIGAVSAAFYSSFYGIESVKIKTILDMVNQLKG